MTALDAAKTALAALDLDATTARAYAEAENAVREARMAEAQARGEDLWCGMHPMDDDFWAQQATYGVKTARDLVRRDLIATHSDLYKSEHGIRPRWVKYDDLTIEELEALIDAI